MLNAVKHLYRIVERKRNNAAKILYCVYCDRSLSLISGFPYLVLLMCFLLASTSKAQNYTIKTLDGTNAIIKIQDRAFAPFTIFCSTDKLILPGYWAPGEVKVLNKKFLEIRYYVRGGSGVGRGNTLLLCLSHGKLRQAMHISSYSYDMGDEEIKTNYTHLLLSAANTAHATVYDTVESKQSSQSRSINIKKSNIKFNLTQRIFCNYQKKVDASLGSYNYKTNKFGKQHFTGIVPAFQLDGCEYIFIGGRWYGKGGYNKDYILID